MRKALCFLAFSVFIMAANAQATKPDSASAAMPDTVKAGIYITSIHDIDFRQKEYNVNFWLWLKYKNRDFDFMQNLEIPNAKNVTKSFSTLDSSSGQYYLVMKIQCTMKDSWKIGNFPFDRQKLRIYFENSQYDISYLVFAEDTLGNHYDPRFTLSGWKIDSCRLSVGKKAYETAFGDTDIVPPRLEFSSFRAVINIKREAGGLFWKMFLGMYIAFFIAYVCFYIHADGIDSRFGLSVGALFAVIGNKYIIDSSLPESTTFTLVDTLHGITLCFILAVITATAYSMKLVKNNKVKQANKFDMVIAQVLLLIYLALNIYYISTANSS